MELGVAQFPGLFARRVMARDHCNHIHRIYDPYTTSLATACTRVVPHLYRNDLGRSAPTHRNAAHRLELRLLVYNYGRACAKLKQLGEKSFRSDTGNMRIIVRVGTYQ